MAATGRKETAPGTKVRKLDMDWGDELSLSELCGIFPLPRTSNFH